jgi:tetratricopeptide (TPR) repeat protein
MMKRGLVSLLSISLLAGAGCSHNGDLTRSASQQNFGVQSAKMNLWREALFRFQRAVEMNPNDAMARNNLAVAYEAVGDFDKARVAYIEALRLDKSNEYIQKNYSRYVEFIGRNKKRQQRNNSPARPAATTPTPAAPPAPAATPSTPTPTASPAPTTPATPPANTAPVVAQPTSAPAPSSAAPPAPPSVPQPAQGSGGHQ